MVTRDFDAMLAERAGVRPTFRVGGQTFTAKSKVPFRKFSRLMASFTDDAMTEEQATENFFNLVLIREDRERFFALLDADGDEDGTDDDGVITSEQMNDITEWLMELYTGKQRESSTSSTNGSGTTGASRNVVSLNSRTATA